MKDSLTARAPRNSDPSELAPVGEHVGTASSHREKMRNENAGFARISKQDKTGLK